MHQDLRDVVGIPPEFVHIESENCVKVQGFLTSHVFEAPGEHLATKWTMLHSSRASPELEGLQVVISSDCKEVLSHVHPL